MVMNLVLFALLALIVATILTIDQPRSVFAGGPSRRAVRPLISAALGAGLILAATVFSTTGKAIVTNRILAGGTEPLNVGWGTGAGTAVVGDTTLFTETALDLSTTSGSRTAGSSSRVTTTLTNDTYQVTATKTASAGGTVTNAGIFDNITIGSGNPLIKGDFTGIVLANGDSIAFTFQLKIA